jgi:hypothetical protein
MKTLAGKIKLLALVIILGGILVTSIVGCSPSSSSGTSCIGRSDLPTCGYTPDHPHFDKVPDPLGKL